ncbi:MAG: hypothetical protein AB1640_12750 [bacterium]
MKRFYAVLVGCVLLMVPVLALAADSADSPQAMHLELLKRAKDLYDKDDSAGAVGVCDEYLKKLGEDFHPQVWFLRGNAYHKLFKKSHKEGEIARAIESYEKGLALYRDIKTFTSLDAARYQMDGLFNLGLLYEEQYELLYPTWDGETRKEREWKILSNIEQAMVMAETLGEWKDPLDEQRERYLDRSLETFLSMILVSDMPEVYKPLTESVCARGTVSKDREKYQKYAKELSFDSNLKTCVHWIRGKELAESYGAYDEAIGHLRKGLVVAQTDRAKAAMSRQIADVYLKKDSIEDKQLALDYATQAWQLWASHSSEWGTWPELFETYGSSLKGVAVGYAMMKQPDYDRIIQLCHQSFRIPAWKDQYYMSYLLAFASYQKGDEDQFYRYGKQAVQVILDKYNNDFEKIQSDEEKEVLLFWVNSLRGSGRILEAMRYKNVSEQLSKSPM